VTRLWVANSHFCCVRIAQQITRAFGVEIDRDVVRRVPGRHYRPGGFGIELALIDGVSACRMSDHAVAGTRSIWRESWRHSKPTTTAIAGTGGLTPAQRAGTLFPARASLDHYGWQQSCRGLFEIPVAA